MKVNISQSTLNILKNFSSINKSIVIKPGSVISTLSINKNILARAEITETFPSELSIYDLGLFLGGLSLLKILYLIVLMIRKSQLVILRVQNPFSIMQIQV